MAIDAEVTLSQLYDESKESVKEVSTINPIVTSQAPSTHTQHQTRFYRTSKKDLNTEVNELEAYFKDEDYIPEDQAHDPHSILTWWKVGISFNNLTFLDSPPLNLGKFMILNRTRDQNILF